jgi:hypothetical protein
MVEKIREDAEDVAKGLKPAPTAGHGNEEGMEAVKKMADEVTAFEPRELEFKVDLPGVTAQDLYVLPAVRRVVSALKIICRIRS